MPAATFRERSRTSMEHARQTVGTVGKAFRHRASSLTSRSFPCWVFRDEEPAGLSRSFTASAQPLSARRGDITESASSSPRSMQQVRYSTDGDNGPAAVHEQFVVQNRDPLRDEEYPSLSSRPTSEADRSLSTDSDPLYLSLKEIWAMNHERDAIETSVCGKEDDEEEEEEFPMNRANKAQHSTTTTCRTSPHPQPPPQTIITIPETAIPIHHFDAELHLGWSLNQSIPPRNFALANLLPNTREETPPVSTPRRRKRRSRRIISGEAERRKGRVFDSRTDYTQPPSSSPSPSPTNEDLSPKRHIPDLAERRKGRVFDSSIDYTQPPSLPHTNNIPEDTTPHPPNPPHEQQQAPPSLVPAKRALPRAPLAAPPERNPVRVTTTRPSQKRRPKKRKHNPTIRISMFHPIIGAHEHGPSPLQTLPANAISTSAAATTTSFPYHAPEPQTHPYPSRRHHQQHQQVLPNHSNTVDRERPYREIDPAKAFILTDAEFPRELSRDGPGSRFPAHLVADYGRRVGRKMEEGGVPEVVLTSPTCTRVGSHSTAATQMTPDEMREDDIDESVGLGDFVYGGGIDGGEGEGDGGRKRYLPYRPPPSPSPPPPSPSPSPAPSSDDDIIAQAVALQIIHFASRSPPPPIYYPAPPPAPPSTSTAVSFPTATTTTKTPTTTDGTIREFRTPKHEPNEEKNIRSARTEPKPRHPSPSPSLLSNASSIVRLIESGVVDFSPVISTPASSAIDHHDGMVRSGMEDEDEVNGDGVEGIKGKEERWKRLTLDTKGWMAFGAGGWGF